jgi:hypothetical protein
MSVFRPRIRAALLTASVGVLSPGALGQPRESEPTPPAAPATPAPEAASELGADAALARSIAFFDAGSYDQCVASFGELLSAERKQRLDSPRSVEQARIYYAACLIAEGKTPRADEQFRLAIRSNPQLAVPSPVIFPQAVIDRFLTIRSSMFDEIRRAQEKRAREARQAAERAQRKAEAERKRVEELERLARQETLVIKNQRWVASIPFGVGQFQNRDYFKGALFLGVEVALGVTAVTATAIELSLHSQAAGGVNLREEQQLNQNLETARLVSLLSTGGLVLTAVGGILEAHLSFVPEFPAGTRQRPRALVKVGASSPGVTLSPIVGPMLGVQGSF